MRGRSGGLVVSPLGMWAGLGTLWWLWGVTAGNIGQCCGHWWLWGVTTAGMEQCWGHWWLRGVTTGLRASVVTPGRLWGPVRWPWLFPAINHR